MAKKYINIIITVTVVLTLCLIIFSITYAWFSTRGESSEVDNAALGGSLDIIYQNGQDITGNLTPAKSNINALSTTATIRKSETSVDALATITLNVENISPELAINAFKWEVYQDDDTDPIYSGTFNNIDAEDKIILVDKYLVTNSDTTFTLKLWLNGDETDNTIANKSFRAYIDASAINAPATIS